MKKLKFALMAGIVATAGVTAGEVLAQDTEAGKAQFRKCQACHSVVKDQHKIGPSLFGVVGRTPGSSDFRYSNAMKGFGEAGNVWDEATLDIYIENPRVVVPGTRMAFPGVKDADDRAVLIIYLLTLEEE